MCICLICGLFTRVYSCKMLTVFNSSTNTYRKPLWKHWATFGVLWLSGANNATTVIRFHLTLNSRMLSAFPWKKIINEIENLFVLRIFLTFYRKCSIFSVRHRTVFMNSLWKVDVHGVFFFSFNVTKIGNEKKMYIENTNDWWLITFASFLRLIELNANLIIIRPRLLILVRIISDLTLA